MKIKSEVSIVKTISPEDRNNMIRKRVAEMMFKQFLESDYDLQLEETDDGDSITYSCEIIIQSRIENDFYMSIMKDRWKK